MTAGPGRAGAPGGPAAPPDAGPGGRRSSVLERLLRLRRQWLAICWLTLVWVLLARTFTAAAIVGGLVVAVGVCTVFPLPRLRLGGRVRPVPLLMLLGRFAAELVVASVRVAWTALRPHRPLLSAVIAVPMRSPADLNLALTCELVSLVPGTLVIDVDREEGVLYVHVFNVRDMAAVEAARAHTRRLEADILRATGQPAGGDEHNRDQSRRE